MIVEIIAGGGVVYGLYRLYKQYRTRPVGSPTGVTAFARLAEADGKIIALKAAAEVKKAEALVAADAVEEIHSILG